MGDTMNEINYSRIPANKRENFKGSNFVTPNTICYYDLRNGIYVEFSWGKGIFSDKLFGVTCSDGDSTCFRYRAEAERWIKMKSYEEEEDE